MKQSNNMLGAVWLCVLALALPCWTYPSGHKTTCEEFSRGTSFDPLNAVGEWFSVYSFENAHRNLTEKITISELTSSQLEQHDQVLREYSKDKLKLEFKVNDSYPIEMNVDSVLVPLDDAGNVDAWATRIQIGDTDLPMNLPAAYSLKWKKVDDFLVLMLCDIQRVYIVSKTATPDKDKLQRVVDSLDIRGITGGRIYSSLLTLF